MTRHTFATLTAAAILMLGSAGAVAMPVLSANATNGFNGSAGLSLAPSASDKAVSGRIELDYPDATNVYQGASGQNMGSGIPAAPEPGMLALIGLGLLAMALRRRR